MPSPPYADSIRGRGPAIVGLPWDEHELPPPEMEADRLRSGPVHDVDREGGSWVYRRQSTRAAARLGDSQETEPNDRLKPLRPDDR